MNGNDPFCRNVCTSLLRLKLYRMRLMCKRGQGLRIRLVRSNRRTPVPVYRTGLTGNRSKPVGFKFEFKSSSATGLDRFAGRFDLFTKWASCPIFFLFFFGLTSNVRKLY